MAAILRQNLRNLCTQLATNSDKLAASYKDTARMVGTTRRVALIGTGVFTLLIWTNMIPMALTSKVLSTLVVGCFATPFYFIQDDKQLQDRARQLTERSEQYTATAAAF